MFEQIIEFQAQENLIEDESIHPIPAKLSIPQWYKDVKNPSDQLKRTIKACKPFLDSITAGYIIKNPKDQKINFNVTNPKDTLDAWVEVSQFSESVNIRDYNMNMGDEWHSLEQIGGMSCPYAQKNKGFKIYKLNNPWVVKVPKGYGILYLPPINRNEDRFEIITGLVDYNHPIQTNFPCVFKKEGTWILRKGEPIASVFPFKIDSWKMKIKPFKKNHIHKAILDSSKHLTSWYERQFWTKKTWK